MIARGEPGVFKAAGFTYRFVKPPRGFRQRNRPSADGVTVVDRLGLEVRVTTIERTIADLFDRYDLAGDADEPHLRFNKCVKESQLSVCQSSD